MPILHRQTSPLVGGSGWLDTHESAGIDLVDDTGGATGARLIHPDSSVDKLVALVGDPLQINANASIYLEPSGDTTIAEMAAANDGPTESSSIAVQPGSIALTTLGDIGITTIGGHILVPGLPAVDPGIADALWDDGTGVKVSGDTAGGTAGVVPVGGIILWSGTIASIPATWALCDGTANSPGPDLRDTFVVGAKQDSGGVAKTNITGALTQSGGSISHAHTASGGAVDAHSLSTNVALSAHSAHSGTAVGTSGAGTAHSHTLTSPSGQATTGITIGTSGSGSSHTHTASADHSALTNNHSGTAVGTSAAGSAHTHGLGTLATDTHGSSATGSSGTARPTLTAAHTLSGALANESTHTHAAGTVTQPTAHGAISSHGALGNEAAHTHAAGSITEPNAGAGHSHTITSPSGNESTHTHAAGTVTQPSAHSDHTITQPVVANHSFTQPTIGSQSAPQPYYALAYIQRMS